MVKAIRLQRLGHGRNDPIKFAIARLGHGFEDALGQKGGLHGQPWGNSGQNSHGLVHHFADRTIAVIGPGMDRRGQLQEGPCQIKGFIGIKGRDAGFDHGDKTGQVFDKGLLLAPIDIAGGSPQGGEAFSQIRRHLLRPLRSAEFHPRPPLQCRAALNQIHDQGSQPTRPELFQIFRVERLPRHSRHDTSVNITAAAPAAGLAWEQAMDAAGINLPFGEAGRHTAKPWIFRFFKCSRPYPNPAQRSPFWKKFRKNVSTFTELRRPPQEILSLPPSLQENSQSTLGNRRVN